MIFYAFTSSYRDSLETNLTVGTNAKLCIPLKCKFAFCSYRLNAYKIFCYGKNTELYVNRKKTMPIMCIRIMTAVIFCMTVVIR